MDGAAILPPDADPREGAIRAARAQGCRCEPDVELVEVKPGIYAATIAHDAYCPLIRSRDRN